MNNITPAPVSDTASDTASDNNQIDDRDIKFIENQILNTYSNLKKQFISGKNEFSIMDLFNLKIILETLLDQRKLNYDKMPIYMINTQ